MKEMPNNMFFFGKIGGEYSFSMAINIDSTNNLINGHYYYNRKKENLKLIGVYDNDAIALEEYYNDKLTGGIHLKL